MTAFLNFLLLILPEESIGEQLIGIFVIKLRSWFQDLYADTRIDELKLEFDATTNYSSKFFNGTLRLNYYERDEKHQVKKFDGMNETIFEQKSELEEQKNNNSSRATLSLYGNFKAFTK